MRERNEQITTANRRWARRYCPTRLIGIGLVATLVAAAPADAGPQTPVSDADPTLENRARVGRGGAVPQHRAADVDRSPATGDSALSDEIDEDCE